MKRLNEEFVKAAQAPDIVQMMLAQAAEVFASPPEDFGKLIESDVRAVSARPCGLPA